MSTYWNILLICVHTIFQRKRICVEHTLFMIKLYIHLGVLSLNNLLKFKWVHFLLEEARFANPH